MRARRKLRSHDMSTESIHNVVVGTAGHIDHGKTALLHALTGIDADRWKEEKERGITIDIGFASRELPDGRTLGFIDVPGHERFIRNMVAGEAGVDVVLLVVAADDGVMPQTREHLDIIELLGVRRGVVAVTKTDLADEEIIQVVEEEVNELLEGSSLAGSPVIRTSAKTGAGVNQLWGRIVEAALAAEAKDSGGLFRMPIQRVFGLHGHGTVVTGVPVSGTIGVGGELEVLPAGVVSRVRRIQAHHLDVELARAGHRAALNLPRLEKSRARRGSVVAAPGYFRAASLLDAELIVLPSSRKPLRTNDRLTFYTGTAEVSATLYVLAGKSIEPGGKALVQLRLSEPVVFERLDRFLLRVPSPPLTVGGGRIVGEAKKRLRPKRRAVRAVEERLRAAEDDSPFVAWLVKDSGGLESSAVARRARLTDEEASSIVKDLLGRGELATCGNLLVHRVTLEGAASRLERFLRDYHASHPERTGPRRDELARVVAVEPRVGEVVLSRVNLAEEARPDGVFVRLTEHAPRPEAGEELAEGIEKLYAEAGFSPRELDELARKLGEKEDRVERGVEYLVSTAKLVRIPRAGNPPIVFAGEAVERARAFVERRLREKGSFTTQEFKAFAGASRKFVLTILEHFDSIGLTRREGEVRRKQSTAQH